jgi:hypothetical protein
MFVQTINRLSEKVKPQEKRTSPGNPRSPVDTLGVLKDHPIWGPVTEAIEKNRQVDSEDGTPEKA